MIISRTPLRVSFVGGGTDLSAFYKKEAGEVISTAINKFMYVTLNKRFDDTIRLSYTRTEIVDKVDQLKHGLVREAMKLSGVTQGVEITTIADIPAKGTGLGSSSSLVVGLLNALYAYKGLRVDTRRLAEEACKIEIDILKEPIGKQDQYIAAYGGFKHFYFKQDGEVMVEPLLLSAPRVKELQENLMMFYTHVTRSAHSILKEQKAKTSSSLDELRGLKNLVSHLRRCLESDGRMDAFGAILHQGWELKKRLASSISNKDIDGYYAKALLAGAQGGKILGAGGGGFLLLYCAKQYQEKVIKALANLKYVPVALEPEGSRIIYADY